MFLLYAQLAGQAGPAKPDYFPSVSLDEESRSSDSKKQWYSEVLRTLDEPSFAAELESSGSTESYRFLWLRSFHHPVAIRVDINHDGTSLLTTKISDGKGGYEPGKLIVNRKRRLTKEQTSWFLDRTRELDFWSLPTYERQIEQIGPNGEKTVTVQLDGARWVLEGIKDKKYQIVDRWSPENGAVHTLGIIMLIDLAKLKILYQDVY